MKININKLRKITTSLATAKAISETSIVIKEKIRSKYCYTYSIDSDDQAYLFNIARDWATENSSVKKNKTIGLQRIYNYDSKEYGIIEVFANEKEQIIKLGKYYITVKMLSASSNVKDGNPTAIAIASAMAKKNIVFSAFSQAGSKAIKDLLNDLVANQDYVKNDPDFLIWDGKSSWQYNHNTKRSPDTIVLADGVMKDLLADIDQFIADEDSYNLIGSPYHRGYLLYGKPGTGKTSIAKAIATYTSRNMYYMPLAGKELDDARLTQMIASINPNSILLLEDIDTIQASHARNGDNKTSESHVTTGGLLNVLDGVTTPYGIIIIMTTNHIDKIDEAIKRPGRADRLINISKAKPKEAKTLYKTVFKVDWPKDKEFPSNKKIVPAEIAEAIKFNLHDPDKAAEAIVKLWQ